jgi:Rps23 Pro-64 3,4-dihydroxylase Tpa1-like proline 4-hydroxylase
MNKYINCINYLVSKKTQDIPHNNKTFFQHLLNVYNKLKKWNCNENICYAGLFHSIYGNEIFNVQIEKDREVIKDLIGIEAETLVYDFNKDRFKTKELRIISLANNLDQNYIEVIDNYFDLNDILKHYFYFRDTVGWKFLGSARDFTKWRKFNYELRFKNEIEKKFKTSSEALLKQTNYFDLLKLESVYASANPYGTVHEAHTDFPEQSQGGITIMYYLNSDWNLDYAGETVFYNENKDIMNSIIPKPGRLVMFDSMIKHCARDVRRDVNDLRMVLTFKYCINI